MSPPRNDIRNDIDPAGSGSTCPTCGAGFTRSRRQRYCTPACRQAAWRNRHPPAPTTPTVPAGRPRREITVYACPECEQRYLAQQWCHDCNRPCRKIDIGGLCHNCDEPVAISDLLDQHLMSSTTRA